MKFEPILIVLIGISLLLSSCEDEDNERDTTPPAVVNVYPEDGAVDVRSYTSLHVTFSEDIDMNTVTTSSFYLEPPVDGWIFYNQYNLKSVTLDIFGYLEMGVEYVAVLDNTISDIAGNRMEEDYIWSFTTLPDTVKPKVVSISPDSNSTFLPYVAYDQIRVWFSEEIDISTVSPSSFYLTPEVDGTISFADSNKLLIYEPGEYFECNTDYTVTISNAITDLAGNHIENDFSWSYDAYQDTIKPEIVYVRPEDGTVDSVYNILIFVAFSEIIDTSTISSLTFEINPPLSGCFSFPSNYSFNFIPSEEFLTDTMYTITAKNSITDICGNELGEDYTWSFTTE